MVTEIVPIFITSYYSELFVHKPHDDTAIGDIIKSFTSDFRHPKTWPQFWGRVGHTDTTTEKCK